MSFLIIILLSFYRPIFRGFCGLIIPSDYLFHLPNIDFTNFLIYIVISFVVYTGNGPSAISLSYFLHGNSPYYKGGCDIETLDNGLKFLKEELDDTLLLQDYFGVAEGCEGRSHNPVAVFFDTLSRPDADLGVVRSSLLEWENRPDLKVNHLILGKGRPGGCWEVSNAWDIS